MTNMLAYVGMCWRQPSTAEQALAVWPGAGAGKPAAAKPGAAPLAAAAAAADSWASAMPQAHDAHLSAVAAVRARDYSFAIRPRGTPPV